MAETYLADITHYLDEDGEIAFVYAAGLCFAEYLTSIISMISHPQPVRRVQCEMSMQTKEETL